MSKSRTGVFDHSTGGGEPGRVAGLSQDARTTKSGQANDRADQLGQLQLVENRDHAGFGLAQAMLGVAEAIQQQSRALQCAGAVSGHPSGVGGGHEQQPHDPTTRPFPLPGNDFSPYSRFEAGRAQASQPGRVTIGATKDDAHRGEPGPGAKRLLGRGYRRRPHALQQVTDLLDLADCLSKQPFAAGGIPSPTSASGGRSYVAHRHAERLSMPICGCRTRASEYAQWHSHANFQVEART